MQCSPWRWRASRDVASTAQVGSGTQETVDDLGRPIDDVFAVVDDQQCVTVGEVRRKVLGGLDIRRHRRADAADHRGQDVGVTRGAREIDEEDATRKVRQFLPRPRRPRASSRLRPNRSMTRGDVRAGAPGRASDEVVPADECRALSRKRGHIAAHRAQRRKLRRHPGHHHLEEVVRAVEVAKPMLTEIDEGNTAAPRPTITFEATI